MMIRKYLRFLLFRYEKIWEGCLQSKNGCQNQIWKVSKLTRYFGAPVSKNAQMEIYISLYYVCKFSGHPTTCSYYGGSWNITKFQVRIIRILYKALSGLSLLRHFLEGRQQQRRSKEIPLRPFCNMFPFPVSYKFYTLNKYLEHNTFKYQPSSQKCEVGSSLSWKLHSFREWVFFPYWVCVLHTTIYKTMCARRAVRISRKKNFYKRKMLIPSRHT